MKGGMRHKKYKVGDRIYYKTFDGTIATDIVIKVEEQEEEDEKGRPYKYQWLTVDECFGIENYNCLSPSNPQCAAIARKYAKFDKVKGELLTALQNVLSPWPIQVQKLLLKELQTRIND